MPTMNKAVFIERDTFLDLTRRGGHRQSTPKPAELPIDASWLSGMLLLRSAGFMLIATTNKPEISAGTLSRRELDGTHERLRARLPLVDIFVCPHEAADHCPCRKPQAGLFHEAAFKYKLSLAQSFVISDRWQDAEAARVIGATSLLIESPWLGRGHHDLIVHDFAAAVEKVLERGCRPRATV